MHLIRQLALWDPSARLNDSFPPGAGGSIAYSMDATLPARFAIVGFVGSPRPFAANSIDTNEPSKYNQDRFRNHGASILARNTIDIDRIDTVMGHHQNHLIPVARIASIPGYKDDKSAFQTLY